jgi:hypothetical protein
MRTFTILKHHEKEEDDDCGGDYWDLEILDENGACIQTYGDDYHESGSDKAEGFVDGVRYASSEAIEIKYENVADREY